MSELSNYGGYDYNFIHWINFFLSPWGIDRLLTGNILFFVLKLVTGCGFFVWCIVDSILLTTGSYKDADGKIVWENNEATGRMLGDSIF